MRRTVATLCGAVTRDSFPYTAAINWYPGHMATASRALGDRLRGVDVVLDVRDARVRGWWRCCGRMQRCSMVMRRVA